MTLSESDSIALIGEVLAGADIFRLAHSAKACLDYALMLERRVILLEPILATSPYRSEYEAAFECQIARIRPNGRRGDSTL